MEIRRRVATLGVALVLAGATSGCTRSVDAADVEKGVSDKLAADAGEKPSRVSCPDLDSEKGASVVCAVRIAEEDYEAKVTVVRVVDGVVDYEVAAYPKQ